METSKAYKKYFIAILVALYAIAALLLLFRYREFKNQNQAESVAEKVSNKKNNANQAVPVLKNRNEKLNPYKRENKKASAFFEELFLSIYSTHYTDIKVKAFDYSAENVQPKKNQKYFFVELQKKLVYDSVYELPFVKGMEAALLRLDNASYAKTVFDKKVAELAAYIGKLQTEYTILAVETDKMGDFIPESVSLSTYMEVQSIDYLVLPGIEQLQTEGKNFLLTAAKYKESRIPFDNEKAVSYALKFSSNPKNKEADLSAWNSDYTAHENDCANFVSQCLYAGGIPQTETWRADSLYWIRTGSLRTKNGGVMTYMQRKEKFLSVGYAAVSAGGFICLNDESHVMLVTANDSITALYNGHTNDRSLFALPHFDTTKAVYLTPNNYGSF